MVQGLGSPSGALEGVYLSRLQRLDNFLAGQANTAYSNFMLSKTDSGFLAMQVKSIKFP